MGKVEKVPDGTELWVGAWKAKAVLKRKFGNPGEVWHGLLPPPLCTPISLGLHSGFIFYQGQFKLCQKCGEEGHVIAQCTKKSVPCTKEKDMKLKTISRNGGIICVKKRDMSLKIALSCMLM